MPGLGRSPAFVRSSGFASAAVLLFGLVCGGFEARAASPVRATAIATADDAGCEPIAAEDAVFVSSRAEPGVVPSQPATESAGPGEIVPLPAGANGANGSTGSTGSPRDSEVAGQALLVLPKGADGTVPTDFELAPGATVAASFFSPVLCATVVRVIGPPDRDPAALVARAPDGAVTVPNHIYVAAQAEVRTTSPSAISGDDPYRSLQWGLDRADAARAWSVANGSGARIALLDSAPETAHRDLDGVRVVSIPGEPAPAPALHGSLMAGVTSAVAGNEFGIAGVAPGAELLAIPVCRAATATGGGDECALFELLRGVDIAWEQRAQVLNLSLVGPPNALLRRAMDRMDGLGVVVVAAAGNEAVAEPRYPAAYPSVIGVGALDRTGRAYARGNRGPAVEVLAPGVEILSTVPGGRFAFGDGTSLAAAHVTGVLALAIAASGDPLAARAAFFRAAQARTGSPGNEPAPLPTACAVLAILEKPCS